MKLRILLGTLATVASFSASAEWVGGVNVFNLSSDDDGVEIGVNGVSGSIGYEFKNSSPVYIVPEVRVGTGISGHTENILGVDVDFELDQFYGAALRAQYDVADNISLFVAPTYTNFKLSASGSVLGNNFTVSEDEWDAGVYAGAAFKVSDSAAVEVTYESVDGIDMAGVGMKFSF